jgi:carbon monoxide dehydrogenase subunit G
MLHFEGDQSFTQTRAYLSAKLGDARFLVQCIPDVESVSEAQPAQAVCVLRPGFAFVRGTLEVSLQVTTSPEGEARFLVRSKGIGSSSTVVALLSFSPEENGTRIHWQVDVQELGGLLKAVPRGLIQAAAQKVIADVWKGVTDKLNAA